MKLLALFIVFLTSSFCLGQQYKSINFEKVKCDINLEPKQKKVKGDVVFKFKVLQSTDSVFVDAVQMNFENLKLNNETLSNIRNTNQQLIVYHNFKKDSVYHLSFRYSVVPKKALYFLKRQNDWNIWTQGQGKYTSHWLPSFDDTNQKLEFDLTITFSSAYEVLANGVLKNRRKNDSTTTWSYDMEKPMSSYLVALAIGKYNSSTETSKSGVPLVYYYFKNDTSKVEPTYRYSKTIFDFFEDSIGVAYPWQIYKQVPVHDFLYAGMENTSLTIFSEAFMVDSIGYNDQNYININAHELAHQWFGNLVTAASGEHHWLQEGFATFYALQAEKLLFGDDYYHFKLYESAQQLARQDAMGQGTSLLNPKSSSLTFYQRGAWVLHALKHKIGKALFKKAVQNYLLKYQYKNATTTDFFKEIEALYQKDLSDFRQQWLKAEVFPFEEALSILRAQSAVIKEYMMINCEKDDTNCQEVLESDVSDKAKIKIIAQAPGLVSNKTFNNNLQVRQAIAQYVTDIPSKLKNRYETLLKDKSFLTVEMALYNLWLNFPTDRGKYLAKTEQIIGFSDKNVRLLWLVLNLNTPEYQTDKTQDLINELISYTDSYYSMDVRMKAFEYLDVIGACNSTCMSNLKEAKGHHNWRMVKFAKEQLASKTKE